MLPCDCSFGFNFPLPENFLSLEVEFSAGLEFSKLAFGIFSPGQLNPPSRNFRIFPWKMDFSFYGPCPDFLGGWSALLQLLLAGSLLFAGLESFLILLVCFFLKKEVLLQVTLLWSELGQNPEIFPFRMI